MARFPDLIYKLTKNTEIMKIKKVIYAIFLLLMTAGFAFGYKGFHGNSYSVPVKKDFSAGVFNTADRISTHTDRKGVIEGKVAMLDTY
ncbi:hypothetical protein CIN01S_10_02290 [Chryseobacterium indologenes NBRC 14944]|nr:hypothetical protein CIN01S_10_02290 [Chryseobacterium indologenes NBRC 14944]